MTTPPGDAWAWAHRAADAAGVRLEPLTTVAEAAAINEVMGATWGGQHIDRELLRAFAVSGNLPWGAFAGGRLVGYVLGFAGIDDLGLHVHSHMLATLPDRRHAGVGYALKLAQRAHALDQGITVIRWTFDPMVARNAWFNLGKLGCVIDRFDRDFYGAMDDRINEGDRSDRCTVRWDLAREPGPRGVPGGSPRVEVPPEYHDLRRADPQAAREARDRVAAAFEEQLAAGRVGAAFDRATSSHVFAREEDLG